MNSNQNSKALSIHTQQRNTPATLDQADIVIIGNGIAGLTAAMEARRYDPSKRIVMMTDQLHPTIRTPALKQFAMKKLKREQLLAYPPGIEHSLNIHVINAHVEEIHAESKYLVLDGKRVFGYGKLLIATGSQPMGLPEEIPGRNFDGVIVLHRLQDYLDLRRRLPEVREAVVIGGGTHASEVVMSLLHANIRVHWLLRSKHFLSHTLDNTASELVLNNVRRAGAIIHAGTEVNAILGRVATVAGVITNTNEIIPCQLVVSAIGTRPAQGLATRCTSPIVFNNGILVDEQLRTSVRDIYAAGDVAALPNRQTGYYETRAQWYYAVMQGKVAGAVMVGHTEMAQELFGAYWHATPLGELSMLTVGNPLNTKQDTYTAIYTDASGGGYRRLAIVDDRLVGYLSVGPTQPGSLSIKRLIDDGCSIRDILKPLLKGNFDAHSYLLKTRTRMFRNTMTLQLPLRERLQGMRWPERETFRPQSSIQKPPAARQIDEMVLDMQKQQNNEENAIYKRRQTQRNVDTAPLRQATTGQLMGSGFIDTPYKEHENLDALALSYKQPGQDRATEALIIGIRKSQQARGDARSCSPLKDETKSSTDSSPKVKHLEPISDATRW